MYDYQCNVEDPFAKAQVAQKMRQAEQEHMERVQSQLGYQGNVLGAERMPEIIREAERIEILMGQLGQLCNQLDVRLMPVTRASVPSPTSNQCQRDANSSPFACRLASTAEMLEGNLDMLRDLINRLEV